MGTPLYWVLQAFSSQRRVKGVVKMGGVVDFSKNHYGTVIHYLSIVVVT